jgi:hypothetical protein
MNKMPPLLNGTVYSHQIDGWSVSWESNESYRHWCHQVKAPSWKNLLVIMFNPGSLSGNGSNLSKDTTLRILREVCGNAKFNPFIVNLFDFASPSPDELFNSWQKRDGQNLIYPELRNIEFSALVSAYGDYENWGIQDIAIKERINFAKESLKYIKEIPLPKNKSGTPKHPMTWQRQKLKPQITELLSKNA